MRYYLATNPDSDLAHGISGADVVKEILGRICILRNLRSFNGIGSEWWAYVSRFMERCDNPDYFTNNQCVEDAYKHAGIQKEDIESCMTNTV